MSPQILTAGAIAIVMALLALAHAAAQIGLRIPATQALGVNFYALQSDQRRLEERVLGGVGQVAVPGSAALARRTLTGAPLSGRALWLLSHDYAMRGDRRRAQRLLERAAMISKRDTPIHLWIADSAGRRGDIETALRHFDMIMRVDLGSRSPLSQRIVSVLPNPEARRALARYANPRNPWQVHFFQAASAAGQSIVPFAQLLLDLPLPLANSEGDRDAYRVVLMRLASEGDHARLLRLYQRLPGRDGNAMRGFAATNGQYPPFDWAFPEAANAGGDVIALDRGRLGLSLFGAAGTTGTAAIKFLVPGNNRRLHWQIVERNGNVGGDARLVVTCVMGAANGQTVTSANLLTLGVPRSTGEAANAPALDNQAEQRPVRATMALPAPCALIRAEFRMLGGLGQEQADLTVSDLRVN